MSKWLKLSLLAVLSLFLANSAPAQSGQLVTFPVWRYTPAGAFPASSAIVTICTSSATGQPCSPTLTVYQDSGLTTPVVLVNGGLPPCLTAPQFGCIDGLGNVSFYMAPGAFVYTVTGSGLNPYGPIPGNSSCTVGTTCVASSGNNAFTGNNTHSGIETFKNINNDLWVDGINYTTLESCYAALVAGQACHVPGNFTETGFTGITFNKSQTGFVFHGQATVTGSGNFSVSSGTFGNYLVSLAGAGPSPSVTFNYTGSGAAFVSNNAGGATVAGLRVEHVYLNLSGAGSSAVGVDLYGTKASLRYVNVNCISTANSQIGFRLGSSASIDSEGTRIEAPGVGNCNIGLQSNASTIFFVYDPNLVGTGLAGTIGLDMEGGATGVSAAHFYGGTISGYQTSLKGVRLVHSTFSSLETESNLSSGTDVTLDSNSSFVTVTLSGSVTKAATDSGTNNSVTLEGAGAAVCLVGCRGTVAATSQKAETGSADANVLTYTPPAIATNYRACFTASVSSATAGVISWTLSWTDSNGNAQSSIVQDLFQDGTAAPATSFTTSAAGNYHFCRELDVSNAAASIIVKWVGGGTTAAKVSATVERII